MHTDTKTEQNLEKTVYGEDDKIHYVCCHSDKQALCGYEAKEDVDTIYISCAKCIEIDEHFPPTFCLETGGCAYAINKDK